MMYETNARSASRRDRLANLEICDNLLLCCGENLFKGRKRIGGWNAAFTDQWCKPLL